MSMASKSRKMTASFSLRRSEDRTSSPEMKRQTASESPELGRESRRHSDATELEGSRNRKKYIHVHHFKNTKLFGAWFNDPSKPGKKKRLFFGSHLTAYLAARAQDRAALKYKPHALDPRSIKLNFKEEDYVADEELREMLTCEEFGELLRRESRPKYTKMEPTPCLRQFLEKERALGNLPPAVPAKEEDVISLRQYLDDVIRMREELDEDMDDAVSSDEEESSEDDDRQCSDKDTEDVDPTPEQNKRARERKKRSAERRAEFFDERGTHSAVAAPSESSTPLITAPTPLAWGNRRQRTKQQGHKYPSEESSDDNNPKSPPALEATALNMRQELEEFLFEPRSRGSMKLGSQGYLLEPAPPTRRKVEKKTRTPERRTEALPENPQFPEQQFRSKRHYKTDKIQNSQTSFPSAVVKNSKTPEPGAADSEMETLPSDRVENTMTPEPEPQGQTRSSESPESQFRSKWHYKMHKIQKSQTTSAIEPSPEPSPKPVERSYLLELASVSLAAAEKLNWRSSSHRNTD